MVFQQPSQFTSRIVVWKGPQPSTFFQLIAEEAPFYIRGRTLYINPISQSQLGNYRCSIPNGGYTDASSVLTFIGKRNNAERDALFFSRSLCTGSAPTAGKLSKVIRADVTCVVSRSYSCLSYATYALWMSVRRSDMSKWKVHPSRIPVRRQR